MTWPTARKRLGFCRGPGCDNLACIVGGGLYCSGHAYKLPGGSLLVTAGYCGAPRLGGLDPSPPRYESAGTWWSKEAEQERYRAKAGARLDQLFGRLGEVYGHSFNRTTGEIETYVYAGCSAAGATVVPLPTWMQMQGHLKRERHCTPYAWITEHGQGARCAGWRTLYARHYYIDPPAQQTPVPLHPCTP